MAIVVFWKKSVFNRAEYTNFYQTRMREFGSVYCEIVGLKLCKKPTIAWGRIAALRQPDFGMARCPPLAGEGLQI